MTFWIELGLVVVGARLLQGFILGLLFEIVLRFFPTANPRREELRAELRAVPSKEQPGWIGHLLLSQLREAISARVAELRAARHRRQLDRFVDYDVVEELTNFVAHARLNDGDTLTMDGADYTITRDQNGHIVALPYRSRNVGGDGQ
jgi:hypothetical protein